jgi:hypothetical protein
MKSWAVVLEASAGAWKSVECASCILNISFSSKIFNVLVIKNLGLNWYPVSDRLHESESENQCFGSGTFWVRTRILLKHMDPMDPDPQHCRKHCLVLMFQETAPVLVLEQESQDIALVITSLTQVSSLRNPGSIKKYIETSVSDPVQCRSEFSGDVSHNSESEYPFLYRNI